MKKYSKILALVVLVLSVFLITGCGSKKDNEETNDNSKYMKEAAGNYTGKYTKFVGDPDDVKDESDTFSLELKEDGTGTHHRDGLDLNIEWSYDGTEFKLTDKFGSLTIEYTGTLKDGKLQIFNGDPKNDLTAEYYYEKN